MNSLSKKIYRLEKTAEIDVNQIETLAKIMFAQSPGTAVAYLQDNPSNVIPAMQTMVAIPSIIQAILNSKTTAEQMRKAGMPIKDIVRSSQFLDKLFVVKGAMIIPLITAAYAKIKRGKYNINKVEQKYVPEIRHLTSENYAEDRGRDLQQLTNQLRLQARQSRMQDQLNTILRPKTLGFN